MLNVNLCKSEPMEGSYPTWTVGQLRTALSTVMPTVLEQNPNTPLQNGVFFSFDRLHALADQQVQTAPLTARVVPNHSYMLPHESAVALDLLLSRSTNPDRWVWVGWCDTKCIAFCVAEQWTLRTTIAGYGDELYHKILRAHQALINKGEKQCS